MLRCLCNGFYCYWVMVFERVLEGGGYRDGGGFRVVKIRL